MAIPATPSQKGWMPHGLPHSFMARFHKSMTANAAANQKYHAHHVHMTTVHESASQPVACRPKTSLHVAGINARKKTTANNATEYHGAIPLRNAQRSRHHV